LKKKKLQILLRVEGATRGIPFYRGFVKTNRRENGRGKEKYFHASVKATLQ